MLNELSIKMLMALSPLIPEFIFFPGIKGWANAKTKQAMVSILAAKMSH
jgi:hypothetical protein